MKINEKEQENRDRIEDERLEKERQQEYELANPEEGSYLGKRKERGVMYLDEKVEILNPYDPIKHIELTCKIFGVL